MTTTVNELVPNTPEMRKVMFRTKYVGGSRRQNVYHASIECSHLVIARRIIKSKLGSMIAGGFTPCHFCVVQK